VRPSQNPLLMSKKRPRSDREVDLPDWADDVTPADEVMKKFYAPTGAFKPGPIAVPPPVNDAVPPAASPEARTGEEARHENTGAEEEKNYPASAGETAVEQQRPEQVSKPQVSLQPELRRAEERPSASPPRTTHQADRAAVRDEVGTEQSAPSPSPRPMPEPAQPSSFDEFARKWKRYLYPGQLAVMRTLFEMTLDRRSFECFTQYSQIASATKMTRRNCINVMNSLVERGFVERLEVRNDATGKGIRLRIHPDPLP
jgi:hypothetical protein